MHYNSRIKRFLLPFPFLLLMETFITKPYCTRFFVLSAYIFLLKLLTIKASIGLTINCQGDLQYYDTKYIQSNSSTLSKDMLKIRLTWILASVIDLSSHCSYCLMGAKKTFVKTYFFKAGYLYIWLKMYIVVRQKEVF